MIPWKGKKYGPSGRTAFNRDYSDVGSVRYRIGLGQTPEGQAAGTLYLYLDKPSADIASPDKLRWSIYDESKVVQDQNNEALRITLPQGAVVVPDPPSIYTYDIQVIDNAQNTKTYTVSRPTDNYNSLQITETPGNKVTSYQWTTATQDNITTETWTMTKGTGANLIKDAMGVSWNDTQTVRTENRTVRNNLDTLVYQEIKKYQVFEWGEELINQQIGAGSDNQTTTWNFYDNSTSDGYSFGRLHVQTQPNGLTATHTYTFDANGNLTAETTVEGSKTYYKTYTWEDLNEDETLDLVVGLVEDTTEGQSTQHTACRFGVYMSPLNGFLEEYDINCLSY